jgi:hypothetical protein
MFGNPICSTVNGLFSFLFIYFYKLYVVVNCNNFGAIILLVCGDISFYSGCSLVNFNGTS